MSRCKEPTLRSSGFSLVLDLRSGTLPPVVHWGQDLGELSVLPEHSRGWFGDSWTRRPSRPNRPVTPGHARLFALADATAEVGAERFVLDMDCT